MEKLDLDEMYPSAKQNGDYKTLDEMNEEDWLYNIRRLRQEGEAALEQADDLRRERERRQAQ